MVFMGMNVFIWIQQVKKNLRNEPPPAFGLRGICIKFSCLAAERLVRNNLMILWASRKPFFLSSLALRERVAEGRVMG